ncbi:hypothetical protein R3P38DRAFT_3236840 [Favolaschia claudopus]|uniref:Uncharacterized protein n=1 Tax=Favolaschia claudopus TaxID=2862362 RepID=A0AAV9ZC26_9AGAR
MHPPSLAQRPSPPLDAPTAHAIWDAHRVDEMEGEGIAVKRGNGAVGGSSASPPTLLRIRPPRHRRQLRVPPSPPPSPPPRLPQYNAPPFPDFRTPLSANIRLSCRRHPSRPPPTTVAKLRFRLLTDDAAPPPSLSHTLYPRSPDAAATRPRAHASTSKIPAKPCLQITPPPPFTPAPLAPNSVTNELLKLFFPRRLVRPRPLASRRPTSPFTPKRAARTRSSKMRVTSLPRPLYPRSPDPFDRANPRYAQTRRSTRKTSRRLVTRKRPGA